MLASQEFFSSTQDLVNSKEQLLRFKLFDKDTCFVILFSLIAIILKKKLCNSGDVEGHQNIY